jgi:RNA polymerase-interacting CarD/CdnL/TRCF family regulator
MTAMKALRFKVGDWIVHDNYGVGEVVDIMEKDLDGQRDTYFKVSAVEIEYWLPSDKADADHIKNIRSQKDFDKALEILSEPPSQMSEPSHRNKRVITERWLDGSLPARAALIRDLNGRNHIKELSYDEKRTYEKAENFFINEWVISNPSLSKTKAKQKLNEALNLGLAKENSKPKQVA